MAAKNETYKTIIRSEKEGGFVHFLSNLHIVNDVKTVERMGGYTYYELDISKKPDYGKIRRTLNTHQPAFL